MSAWIVSSGHIDCLVRALVESELVIDRAPDEIGQELWRENHRSVNYRYNERSRTPHYYYRRPGGSIDVHNWGALDLLVHCYNYQTCERPDYEKSLSHHWVTLLQESLHERAGCIHARRQDLEGREGEVSYWGVPAFFDFPERAAA